MLPYIAVVIIIGGLAVCCPFLISRVAVFIVVGKKFAFNTVYYSTTIQAIETLGMVTEGFFAQSGHGNSRFRSLSFQALDHLSVIILVVFVRPKIPLISNHLFTLIVLIAVIEH